MHNFRTPVKKFFKMYINVTNDFYYSDEGDLVVSSINANDILLKINSLLYDNLSDTKLAIILNNDFIYFFLASVKQVIHRKEKGFAISNNGFANIILSVIENAIKEGGELDMQKINM